MITVNIEHLFSHKTLESLAVLSRLHKLVKIPSCMGFDGMTYKEMIRSRMYGTLTQKERKRK